MESDCDDDISYDPFDDEDYNSNNDEDYNSNYDEDYYSENSMDEEEDERKKLCKKDKREERQNTGNNKSGSNFKIGKTQQAVRVLEEKAIVQSFTYIDKNSEDKEISPLLNNTSIV